MGYGKYEMINMTRSPEISLDYDSKTIPGVSSTSAATDVKYSDGPTAKIASTDLSEAEPSLGRRTNRNHFQATRDRLFNRGWRGGLLRWTILSTAIWTITIIAYVCLVLTHQIRSGSGTIMTATCSRVSAANTVIHLALNIVSSVMLSASAYAQESLCSPTRAEVDAAHAKGRWLGIGGLSLRNFRYISWTRSILWILLSITSIPLHLFFNAVFFTSSQTHQYAVAVVDTEFFGDTAFVPNATVVNPSNYAYLGGYSKENLYVRPNNEVLVDLLEDARRNDSISHLVNLDPAQCISLYSNGFVRDASDVVVVVDNDTSSMPLIWTRYPERSISADRDRTNGDSFNWICHDLLATNMEFDGKIQDRCTPEVVNFISDNGNWTVYGSPVQSCLSRSYPPICHLLFNSWLMVAVLVIGVLKTFTMIYIILRLSKQHNLRTFGDAVASFLQNEDPTTRKLCLVRSRVFVTQGIPETSPQLYDGKPQRWWKSAGAKQFCVTLGVTLLCAILLGIALKYAVDGAYGSAWNVPLGQANIQSLFKVQADDVGSSGIVPNLIVANIPQLVFSFLYMTYNDVLSKMLMGHEFDKFTRRRMPLRVSDRTQGLQRGTRYFSLPMRWALPLMGLGALLHWLASQAMFAVRVDGVDNNDVVDPADQLSRLGYNAKAIVALVAVLLFVAAVLVYIGWWKKFDVSFGEMGNSLVISAACHPPHTEEHADLHLGEVSWGDVTESDGVRHCSFSDRHPVRPMQGKYYA